MGGAVEAVTDAFSDVVDVASDVASVVTDLGTEFLTPEALGVAGVAFGVPTGPSLFSSFGAFEAVGSFAGNASWFDAFNPGQIVSQASTVLSGGGIGGGLGLPGLGNLNFGNLPGISDFNVGSVSQAVRSVSTVLGPAASAASALGIQVPGTQFLGAINKTAGVVSAASAGFSNFGGIVDSTIKNPFAASQIIDSTNAIDRATGLAINTARPVTDAGLNILSDAETRDLLARNIDPRLINGLVDPGTQSPFNAGSYILNQTDLDNLKIDYENQIADATSRLNESFVNLREAENELANTAISEDRRAELQAYVQDTYGTIAALQQNLEENQIGLEQLQANIDNEVVLFDQARNTATRTAAGVNPAAVTAPADNFTEVFDPETGTWSVVNLRTGQTVSSGLTQQQATLAAQNLSIGEPAIQLNSQPNTVLSDEEILARQNAGGLSDEEILARQRAQGATATPQSNIQNLVQQARQQQAARAVAQTQANATDWRVRLRLAPNSNYLYNDPQPGILTPLSTRSGTDGVIFPYTPAIDTAYKANYEAYDLTHSNYRGYFYKNSAVDAVNVRATFTAQDTVEANYLLAVIHFFRSVTRMFYGQDPNRGAPPPLVYLSGYGNYQFNEHPCVVSQFNYNLPVDVDYIRAYSRLQNGQNLLTQRNRRTVPGNPLAYSLDRLLNNKLTKGAEDTRPPLESNLAIKEPTYVPTKIELSFTLLPVQSRSQVSQQFSVKSFANGNLLKAGFW